MSGLWSRVAASWRRWRADPAPSADRPGLQGAYGKQALKETLERKRRNDLVRRAELAQLREIRRRKRQAAEAVAHDAGFFQSSLLSYSGEQSQTLQKIDAVEAQFSRDWWRGRLGGAGVRGAASSVASDAPPASPVSSLAYASTQPVTRGLVSSLPATDGESASADFEASRMAAARVDPLSPADLWPAAPTLWSPAAADVAPQAAEEPVARAWTADASLEEAALRYANGDDAGAYARLLGALREQPQSPQAALWRSALRDLDMLAAAGLLRTAGQPDAGAWDWRCPARLDPAALQELANTLDVAVADPARMLALDWSALRSVAPEAATPLAELLQGCCGRRQPLRLGASQTLETLLREQTPSADDRVPESLWRARLALLRLLGQQDAFELAALDFCISHGVELPVWAAPAQTAQTLLEPPRPNPAPGEAPPPTPGVADAACEGPTLDGELRGDQPATLARLRALVCPADRSDLRVSCAALLRVDFSAAGSLLNTAAALQRQGCRLHLEELPPLVAAFFQVIGIDEHARLGLRAH